MLDRFPWLISDYSGERGRLCYARMEERREEGGRRGVKMKKSGSDERSVGREGGRECREGVQRGREGGWLCSIAKYFTVFYSTMQYCIL